MVVCKKSIGEISRCQIFVIPRADRLESHFLVRVDCKASSVLEREHNMESPYFLLGLTTFLALCVFLRNLQLIYENGEIGEHRLVMFVCTVGSAILFISPSNDFLAFQWIIRAGKIVCVD